MATPRVFHRAFGSIPGCKRAEPSFKPFDAAKYKASVDAYHDEIMSYVEHMQDVRAGLVEQQDAA